MMCGDACYHPIVQLQVTRIGHNPFALTYASGINVRHVSRYALGYRCLPHSDGLGQVPTASWLAAGASIRDVDTRRL
jgi:hypothetical protein